MGPAHQRFKADDSPAAEIDFGLVMENQLAGSQCAPQVGFDLQSGDGALPHGGIEDRKTRLAGSFGGVHGDIGVAQNFFGRLIVVVTKRHSHAEGGEHRTAFEQEGKTHVGLNAFGDAPGVFDGVNVFDEHGKLIAAEARHGAAQAAHEIGRANGLGQTQGHTDQQLVSCDVAETVVDDLEVIEIEKEHAEDPAGIELALLHAAAQALGKEGAVGEAGQGVHRGMAAHLFPGGEGHAAVIMGAMGDDCEEHGADEQPTNQQQEVFVLYCLGALSGDGPRDFRGERRPRVQDGFILAVDGHFRDLGPEFFRGRGGFRYGGYGEPGSRAGNAENVQRQMIAAFRAIEEHRFQHPRLD